VSLNVPDHSFHCALSPRAASKQALLTLNSYNVTPASLGDDTLDSGSPYDFSFRLSQLRREAPPSKTAIPNHCKRRIDIAAILRRLVALHNNMSTVNSSNSAAVCRRWFVSWDFARSALILHGHFSPQLGEKPWSINVRQMPLNQRVEGATGIEPVTFPV
jgi:hypothetical protein